MFSINFCEYYFIKTGTGFACLGVYTKNGTYLHIWKILSEMEKFSIYGTYLQFLQFLEISLLFGTYLQLCQIMSKMVHTYNFGKI